VPIAGIHEQLRALYRLVELARDFEIFVGRQGPLVGVHHVHLERDSLRPRAAELGGRDTGVDQHGSAGAGTRLGQHLRRQHPEREADVDDLVRQAVGGESTALDDRAEADLLAVADAVGQRGEGLAVVEIRGVNDVSRSAKLSGERPDAVGQALGVVEQDQLGHRRMIAPVSYERR
jgi:hypothetical protein